VPYTSGVLVLVGDSGIKDEASSRAHTAAPGRCFTPCVGRGQGGRPGLEHCHESMVVVRDTWRWSGQERSGGLPSSCVLFCIHMMDSGTPSAVATLRPPRRQEAPEDAGDLTTDGAERRSLPGGPCQEVLRPSGSHPSRLPPWDGRISGWHGPSSRSQAARW
jgi:hypothetical protein